MTTTTTTRGKKGRGRKGAPRGRAARAGQKYADAMNATAPGDVNVDGQAYVDDGLSDETIARGLGAVGAAKERAGAEVKAALGSVYDAMTRLRGLAGPRAADLKRRLMRAARDERDPLYAHLRAAIKRIAMKTIVGD